MKRVILAILPVHTHPVDASLGASLEIAIKRFYIEFIWLDWAP